MIDKKLWICIVILAFLLGATFSFISFPRMQKALEYNDHIQYQINYLKGSLINAGFIVNESLITDKTYLSVPDFALFKVFASFKNITVIGLEIEDAGLYLHARFWYKPEDIFVVYEVI
jgi:hypothetical protein